MLPKGSPEVATNSELRRVVDGARRAGQELPTVGLLGGDLCRTVGGLGDRARLFDGRAVEADVDIVRVEIDGRPHWFVSHLVARGSTPAHWWFGPLTLVMNAEFLGRWDVAPRSHPNDGRIEIFDVGGMSLRDRWTARRRLPLGSHLPHPGIRAQRVADHDVSFDRHRLITLDDDTIGRATRMSVHVEPDALRIVF